MTWKLSSKFVSPSVFLQNFQITVFSRIVARGDHSFMCFNRRQIFSGGRGDIRGEFLQRLRGIIFKLQISSNNNRGRLVFLCASKGGDYSSDSYCSRKYGNITLTVPQMRYRVEHSKRNVSSPRSLSAHHVLFSMSTNGAMRKGVGRRLRNDPKGIPRGHTCTLP